MKVKILVKIMLNMNPYNDLNDSTMTGPKISILDAEDEIISIFCENNGGMEFAMPIIRFRTDDKACYTSKKCSCPRNYPLIQSFDGRLQELIVSSSGRKISMTSINFHSDVFDHVRQFQFHQYEKGKVELHIVKMPEYNVEESDRIIKVNLANENGNAVVKINNGGEPIPPERVASFFEKFNTDRKNKKGGTGLGTTYSYLVVKAHGGKISVESNEKEGTTLTVKLNKKT